MPARVNPNAGRKSDAHRQRIVYRQKLMVVSDDGLQRIYEKALEQQRRDVMNWCAIEAGRRQEKRVEPIVAPACLYWLAAEYEIELNVRDNALKREYLDDLSTRTRGVDARRVRGPYR